MPGSKYLVACVTLLGAANPAWPWLGLDSGATALLSWEENFWWTSLSTAVANSLKPLSCVFTWVSLPLVHSLRSLFCPSMDWDVSSRSSSTSLQKAWNPASIQDLAMSSWNDGFCSTVVAGDVLRVCTTHSTSATRSLSVADPISTSNVTLSEITSQVSSRDLRRIFTLSSMAVITSLISSILLRSAALNAWISSRRSIAVVI